MDKQAANYTPLEAADIYREQRAAQGRLVDSAYKALPAYATVTGGLWFFATTTLDKHPVIAAGVFIFAGCSTVAFALLSLRQQHVGDSFLRHFAKWEGTHHFDPGPSRVGRGLTIIRCLLCVACAMSILGAAYALTKLEATTTGTLSGPVSATPGSAPGPGSLQ